VPGRPTEKPRYSAGGSTDRTRADGPSCGASGGPGANNNGSRGGTRSDLPTRLSTRVLAGVWLPRLYPQKLSRATTSIQGSGREPGTPHGRRRREMAPDLLAHRAAISNRRPRIELGDSVDGRFTGRPARTVQLHARARVSLDGGGMGEEGWTKRRGHSNLAASFAYSDLSPTFDVEGARVGKPVRVVPVNPRCRACAEGDPLRARRAGRSAPFIGSAGG